MGCEQLAQQPGHRIASEAHPWNCEEYPDQMQSGTTGGTSDP